MHAVNFRLLWSLCLPIWPGIAVNFVTQVQLSERRGRQMPIYSEPTFEGFVAWRRSLNEELEAKRDAADRALVSYASDKAFSTLALLEGLLLECRNLMSELMILENEFMNHLLSTRRTATREHQLPARIGGSTRPKPGTIHRLRSRPGAT